VHFDKTLQIKEAQIAKISEDAINSIAEMNKAWKEKLDLQLL
jgi:hypothetical protein